MAKIISKDYICGIIVFISMLILSLASSPLGVDFHHDGIVYIPALRISEGGLPYLSGYSHYNLLSVLIPSMVISFFGVGLLKIKVATCFFYAGTATCYFYIWKKIFKSKSLAFKISFLMILCSSFLPWTLLPWSSVYAMFFHALAILCYIYRPSDRSLSKYIMIFSSGLFFGLAFWCRQTLGIVSFLGHILFLIFSVFNNKKFKSVCFEQLFLMLVMLSSFLVPILILKSYGLEKEWVFQIYGALSGWITEIASYLKPKWWLPLAKAWVVIRSFLYLKSGVHFVLLPIISAFYFLFRVNKRMFSDKRDFFLLQALSSWHQYFPVPCFRHYFWGGSIFLGLIPFFSNLLDKSNVKYKKIIKILFFTYIFIFISHHLFHFVLRLHNNTFKVTTNIHLNGFKVDELERSRYVQISDSIKTIRLNYPGKEIVYFGRDGLYELFIRDFNSLDSKFYFMWDNLIDKFPDDMNKIRSYLSLKKPMIILPVKQTKDNFLNIRLFECTTFDRDHMVCSVQG